MKIRTILKNGLLIVVMVFCALRGPNMQSSSILSIYRSLLLGIGILCCVLGVWGSTVYPDALKRAGDEEQYKGSAAQAANVLTPLFLSLVLFLLTFGVSFVAPFLQGADIPGSFRVILKALASGVSAGIFFVLGATLLALAGFVDTMQHIANQEETKTDMRARLMLGTRIRDDRSED